MIKVTITKFVNPQSMIIGAETIKNVTVIDMDECFIRLITEDGKMIKYPLDIVKGYTAEMI